MARLVLDEILEERVVSSRGQHKPRGVKRKMSRYHIRPRGPLSTAKHSWTPRIAALHHQGNSIARKLIFQPPPSTARLAM